MPECFVAIVLLVIGLTFLVKLLAGRYCLTLEFDLLVKQFTLPYVPQVGLLIPLLSRLLSVLEFFSSKTNRHLNVALHVILCHLLCPHFIHQNLLKL